jgi:hypothetical protein
MPKQNRSNAKAAVKPLPSVHEEELSPQADSPPVASRIRSKDIPVPSAKNVPPAPPPAPKKGSKAQARLQPAVSAKGPDSLQGAAGGAKGPDSGAAGGAAVSDSDETCLGRSLGFTRFFRLVFHVWFTTVMYEKERRVIDKERLVVNEYIENEKLAMDELAQRVDQLTLTNISLSEQVAKSRHEVDRMKRKIRESNEENLLMRQRTRHSDEIMETFQARIHDQAKEYDEVMGMAGMELQRHVRMLNLLESNHKRETQELKSQHQEEIQEYSGVLF